MINHLNSVIYRMWLRTLNGNALSLLDIIKQSFYGYGYSMHSIREGGLEKEYDFLLNRRLVKLRKDAFTDEETSIYPTKKGLEVGKIIEEKQKWQKVITKGVWVLLSGVTTTVAGGLILHFGFGVGA